MGWEFYLYIILGIIIFLIIIGIIFLSTIQNKISTSISLKRKEKKEKYRLKLDQILSQNLPPKKAISQIDFVIREFLKDYFSISESLDYSEIMRELKKDYPLAERLSGLMLDALYSNEPPSTEDVKEISRTFEDLIVKKQSEGSNKNRKTEDFPNPQESQHKTKSEFQVNNYPIKNNPEDYKVQSKINLQTSQNSPDENFPKSPTPNIKSENLNQQKSQENYPTEKEDKIRKKLANQSKKFKNKDVNVNQFDDLQRIKDKISERRNQLNL